MIVRSTFTACLCLYAYITVLYFASRFSNIYDDLDMYVMVLFSQTNTNKSIRVVKCGRLAQWVIRDLHCAIHDLHPASDASMASNG